MICRKCGRYIQTNSIYCNWCGTQQIKLNVEKKPKPPTKRKNGTYSGQIMVDGKRFTVTATSEDEYYQKVKMYHSGELTNDSPTELTLHALLAQYIAKCELLSPATLRSYDAIARNRFKSYQSVAISNINWQRMIDAESRIYAPKTVCSSWGLVSTALLDAGLDVPRVHLPRIPKNNKPFLDDKQIKIFLDAIKGTKIESICLFALHSLRVSEIYALTPDSIKDGTIHVHGAVIPDRYNHYTKVELNKTDLSARNVPIIIPRLNEVIADGAAFDFPSQKSFRYQLAKLCRKNGLPELTPHDLRRTFATLCITHLRMRPETVKALGGWTNDATVNEVYKKLGNPDIAEDIEKAKEFFNY